MAKLINGNLTVTKGTNEAFLLLEFIAYGGSQSLNPLTNFQANETTVNVTLNMDKAEQQSCLKYVNAK